MEIVNRKAKFEYFIEETYEAGIELKGTEIKSIRKSAVDLRDSYVLIRKNEVYLLNAFIGKYEEGNIFNHDERRTRKLLLHKNEIKKLYTGVTRNGYALIPLDIHFKNGKAKVTIGLCKGKNFMIREKLLKKETCKDKLKD